MNTNLVWFITGCSTGFGRALAEAAIQAGHKVIVTARKLDAVTDLVGADTDNAMALELDVTKPEQIARAVQAAADKFGRIDVLVNNAGVGYFSSIEEAAEDETRKLFDVNFWGLMHTTNAVLPYMRGQRSGHIINISSIGGLASFPGVGYYNATKYAVEGISESLAKEVAPFGIRVTLIEPGNFRTDWSGRSAAKTASAIKEYEALIAPFVSGANHGSEPGDPKKAAQAILRVAESEAAPLRLLLGAEAYHTVKGKYTALLQTMEEWKDVTMDADYQA
ncbi:oxidoreductase [Paenibacillus sp. MWE-103]|uniref:Oxidoreductase n=1 Tax=Paenibacillus artemisiicola TaxID=1172618 RepID=A0ABS3W414_9BACL|nr:oxidoreductase [Paenibacillus artemisiicola]MBO7743044.1 oxidoreductase [Paenibacillus artemisiicola]